MAKKHGPPLGKSKKKTFKETKSSSDHYRGTCGAGFKGAWWQAHHVIPCVSLQTSLSEFLATREAEYRRALAFFTNWDVNESYNMFGLPVFKTYKVAFDAMRSKKRNITAGPPAWFKPNTNIRLPSMRPKYPIHVPSDWGHKKYERNVQNELDSVWTELKIKDENHEPITPKDLKDDIQAISTDYRGKLEGKTDQKIEDWDNGVFDEFMMV